MQVGDYVRTRDGIISKIEDNFNTTMCISTDRGKYHYEYFDIIKSSPNIIDLIEVGDYVNGEYVLEIYNDKRYGKVIITDSSQFVGGGIKSIVTREQYSQMEYKVVE